VNTKSNISKIISGLLLIAGTTVGAGMLGIPLITAKAGFLPSFVITTFAWIYMFCTGLLFLEVTLWMHSGSNILSMTYKFLGKEGRALAAILFAFLYYTLMVAYFSAGAPILSSFLTPILGFPVTGTFSYAVFGIFFAVVVGIGIRVVDKVNYILMIGLIIAYVSLLVGGGPSVREENLKPSNWPYFMFAMPILFSSFGFHNIIPSLTHHFKDNGKIMRWSIFFGTLVPFIIYMLWQWLIIGAIPKEMIQETLDKGQPITFAMQAISGKSWIKNIGQVFGLFAIVTSLLGVSFSVVDFLGDGLKMRRTGFHRVILCLLTFIPPFVFTIINPNIFVLALDIAGGFGEAILNGILPAWLVWIGRYQKKLNSDFSLPGGKRSLIAIILIGFTVMGLTAYHIAAEW
jgi:tyrosine-specific transport protein